MIKEFYNIYVISEDGENLADPYDYETREDAESQVEAMEEVDAMHGISNEYEIVCVQEGR